VAAPQLDDLRQQQAEPARRRVDEGELTGLHRVEVGREVAGGETLLSWTPVVTQPEPLLKV
jgi:hypothetical protein